MWADSGKAFDYMLDGKRLRFDVATKRVIDAPPASSESQNIGRGMPGRERGRQFTEAASPDGKRKAVYRDRNLWLTDSAGKNAIAIILIADKSIIHKPAFLSGQIPR
jgi:hypothetical protein